VDVSGLRTVREVARAAAAELSLAAKIGRAVTAADVRVFVISGEEAQRLVADASRSAPEAEKGAPLGVLDAFDAAALREKSCLLLELTDEATLQAHAPTPPPVLPSPMRTSSPATFAIMNETDEARFRKAGLLASLSATSNPCANIVKAGDWAVCQDAPRPVSPPCLVYSFGIANDFAFDDYWGNFGCEVHAFDPTLPAAPPFASKNVIFHFFGLSGEEGSGAADFSDPVYGSVIHPLHTLDKIVTMLGHSARTIDILKIDCEGCEWDAFAYLAQHSPGTLSQVRMLDIEVHFVRERNVKSAKDVLKIATFYEHVVDSQGFRPYYVHLNQGGRSWDLVPELSVPGVIPNHCCYEFAMSRVAHLI
jgi:hypothetical protein